MCSTTHTHTHAKQHKVGSLHLLLPTHVQNHKPVQTHYLKITFKCLKTMARLTKTTSDFTNPPYNKGGIYQLTCKSCSLSYVSQTSCGLKIRFQERIRYIRNNNPQSAYAQHILSNQHEYGTLHDIMSLLKPLRNANLLIPYQQFYIQSLHQAGKLISEQYPGEPNCYSNWPFTPLRHTAHNIASRATALILDAQSATPH